jgi:VPDSG-CTERM motif
VNTPAVAIFGGDFSLSSIGDTSGLSTGVGSFLYFTLNEAVNYSVTGTLQLLNPDTESPFNAGALSFNIGFGFAPGFLYGSSVQTQLAGDWHPPQLTGTFAPGNYTFSSQAFALFGGETSGAFSLVLTAIQNPEHHVPDAGSTLTLLGAALGGLGFFIRQRI